MITKFLAPLLQFILGPSWETSIAGLAMGIPVVTGELVAQFDDSAATVFNLDTFLMGLGLMIGLRIARSGNKSSQDHGVRPTIKNQ